MNRDAETVPARHEAPDVAELRRLLAGASPLPWQWEPASGKSWPLGDESLVTTSGDPVLYGWGYDASGIDATAADRALIAAAVNALPGLLDDAAERNALAADADKWQRAALTLQRDRDALTDERDSLSWQAEALRAERDARSSERDALAAKVERVRALPAKHPAGGWYVTSMRDVLAALDEEPQP